MAIRKINARLTKGTEAELPDTYIPKHYEIVWRTDTGELFLPSADPSDTLGDLTPITAA